MNPAEKEYNGRGCLFFAVAMPIALFACVLSIYGTVTFHCVTEADRWLLVYPGAEEVDLDYTWLHAYGIGSTVRVLHTPDPTPQVRVWYVEEITRLDEIRSDQRNDGIATVRWNVFEDPDSDGTLIVLSCNCAPELVLW